MSFTFMEAIKATMRLVATLIVEPNDYLLTVNNVDLIRKQFEKIGASNPTIKWLADNIACDITFDRDNLKLFQKALKKLKLPGPIDIIVQTTNNRKKKLLLADMDSTIVSGETLDELATQANIKNKVAIITQRAMNGEIDFKGALRERVSLLAGMPVSALKVTLEQLKLTNGARTLVQTMRENGAYTVLLSGGFKFFSSYVAKLVGFHEERSNDLIINNQLLTGEVVEPILDANSKLEALHVYSSKQNISKELAIAVGDGANDLPMLLEAGVGVAFRAKEYVEQLSPAIMRHSDLTGLLYIQGYLRDEFKG